MTQKEIIWRIRYNDDTLVNNNLILAGKALSEFYEKFYLDRCWSDDNLSELATDAKNQFIELVSMYLKLVAAETPRIEITD